jgi:membrane fusion protein (multidrug efflux system)
MPRTTQLLSFLATRPCHRLLLALLTIVLSACGSESPQPQSERPAAKVSVAIVELTDTVQVGTYAARLRSTGEVEVRAQVGGILEQRLYTEGALVEKGDTLFQIDPEAYRLALRRAKAELDEAKANRIQAERDLHRIKALFARKIVSKDDMDTADSRMQVTEAQLKRAQSAADDAGRILGYSRVEAPVTGISRLEAVAEGNLVQPGTLLTTLVPLDPIELHFTLPAKDARLRRNADSAPQTVSLILEGGHIYEQKGQLDFTASHINPATDTIGLRAIFPNPSGELLPGQFARVRIPLRTFHDVFLIDPKAVSEGSNGPQVFTINGENKAIARPLELGPILNGNQVVLSGLQAGDQMVVNGQVALRDDSSAAIIAGREGQP